MPLTLTLTLTPTPTLPLPLSLCHMAQRLLLALGASPDTEQVEIFC